MVLVVGELLVICVGYLCLCGVCNEVLVVVVLLVEFLVLGLDCV